MLSHWSPAVFNALVLMCPNLLPVRIYFSYCSTAVIRKYEADKDGKICPVIAVGLKSLPLIQSYGSIQALSQDVKKSDRQHDLVIAVSTIL